MLQNWVCKTHPVQVEFSMNTSGHRTKPWRTKKKGSNMSRAQQIAEHLFPNICWTFDTSIQNALVPSESRKLEKLQVQVRWHHPKAGGAELTVPRMVLFCADAELGLTCSTVALLPFCIGGKWKPRNAICCPWKITRSILFGISVSVSSWAICHTTMQCHDLILSWAALVQDGTVPEEHPFVLKTKPDLKLLLFFSFLLFF